VFYFLFQGKESVFLGIGLLVFEDKKCSFRVFSRPSEKLLTIVENTFDGSQKIF